MTRLNLIINSVKPAFSSSATVLEPAGYCYVCGNDGSWQPAQIINDELANTWSIGSDLRTAFDARESMFCSRCGCSFRLRQLAECLTYIYGEESLEKLVMKKTFSSMKIAEINSCGKLHDVFKKLPFLSYSEYGSRDKSVRAEDLSKLTYKDKTFDLVLTSDTLEHVPNIEKALKEIRRVLKTGGRHVFTVPIIWSRKTNSRKDQVPSYHGAGEPDYLVFNELGYDMINMIKKCGFSVKVYKANIINLNDVAGVIIATRTGD